MMSDLETTNIHAMGTCHGWFQVPFWHHRDGNQVVHIHTYNVYYISIYIYKY